VGKIGSRLVGAVHDENTNEEIKKIKTNAMSKDEEIKMLRDYNLTLIRWVKFWNEQAMDYSKKYFDLMLKKCECKKPPEDPKLTEDKVFM
jgi:hypothetical protein